MRPETVVALERARLGLEKAEFMLSGNYPDEAGRLAYGAGLNAASAYINECTGQLVKTHSGTHGQFSRLIRDNPAFRDEHRRFLGRNFPFKAAADYGVGQVADLVGARESIAMARNLVDAIEAAIAALPPGRPPP